jgi:hypothetical protein
MRQFDMVLIQTLNKFCTPIENTKPITTQWFYYFVFILYK